jgi:hypothetical protein
MTTAELMMQAIPDEALHPHALMIAYRGSVAHGMYTGGRDGIDDIDLMGFFAPTANHYIGFGRHSPETVEHKHGPWDVVYYEVRHFLQLLGKGNPNVLTMLWLKKEAILLDSAAAMTLRHNRAMFATKLTYNTFTGYAYGQLKRMENFDGPARERMRSLETELTRRGIPLDAKPENYFAEVTGGSAPGKPFGMHIDRDLVEDYRQMCAKFTSGYMGQKRRELVERYGYDTKNAAHLLRLQRMGIEFLLTGELIVDRRDAGDAEEFLSVKRGEWSLADVKAKSDANFAAMQLARDSSALPESPDLDAIEELCMGIVRSTVAL